jgi:trehalose 6-phosphate phosphatase
MNDAGRRRHAPPPLHRDHALFLDFDGTLVEIAPAPDLVHVPAELPDLLDELANRLGGAIAVVSGRPLDELARMLVPFAGRIAGDHGLERRYGAGKVTRCRAHPELDRFRPLLAGFATRHPGVLLEDKGGSLALHYRQNPSLGSICHAFLRRAAQASNGALAAVAGKMVIELMPRSAGKGRAIADFLADAPFHGRLPVFIGDDTTDEDGFAVVNRLGGISVHVGGGATIARHNLATVGGVLAWLDRGRAE